MEMEAVHAAAAEEAAVDAWETARQDRRERWLALTGLTPPDERGYVGPPDEPPERGPTEFEVLHWDHVGRMRRAGKRRYVEESFNPSMERAVRILEDG